MANLLTIEKLDNNFFRFTLNGDVANSVVNTMNWLTIVSGKSHFKTRSGANVVKEQDIVFSSITLIDGATTINPISNLDLIDELTALDFFSWTNNGASGVNKFEDLLDTFNYFGKAGQVVVVNPSETQLTTFSGVFVTKSTDLTDMPSAISPGFLLIGDGTGNNYILVNPLDLPVSTATDAAINNAIVKTLEPYDFHELATDGIQTFTLPPGKVAKFGYLNDSPIVPATSNNASRALSTFTQTGNDVTIAQPTYAGQYVILWVQ